MIDVYAKPQDRDEIALYVQEIETDHKLGPDGNLIPVDRVTFGKKGTNTYQMIKEVPRLKRDNPDIYAWFEPLYLGWKKNNEIPVNGLALEAWPAITKGQIKACRDLGLRSVEDIATATSSIREKIGIGAVELIKLAKAFVANKEVSAAANRIASLEDTVAQLRKDLEESRKTAEAMAAKAGQKVAKPRKPRQDDDDLEDAA